MGKSITNLNEALVRGLRRDCESYYPDSKSEIAKLFDTILYTASSADGCLELCKIGKAIETSLITGGRLLLPFSFLNLKRRGSVLPDTGYFLFSRVFHCATGEPLLNRKVLDRREILFIYEPEDPSCEPTYVDRFPQELLQPFAMAAFMLRQLFLLFSKREDLPVLALEDEEIVSFVERVTNKRDITADRHVLSVAREYLRRLFMVEGEIHPSIAQWMTDPYGRHGPGAVFDGATGAAKWSFSRSYTAWKTHHEFMDPTSEASASKSRLTVVPKDFRKHRLICIEQKEMMFQQQGLRSVLEFIVAQNPQVSRCLSFDNQGLNFELSKNTRFSTIDLSDASDLLSRRLVKLLFPREIYKLLVNCRSSCIELPDSSLIQYESMYTMGNALCFTIESIAFAALTAATISVVSGCSLASTTGKFRVFGDDILVQKEYYPEMLKTLAQSGLKPNVEKCCHDSLVRESCGSWFVQGIDIRVVRPRTLTVSNDRDWLSALQVSKNLANLGCTSAAVAVAQHCDSYHPVPFGFFGIPGCSIQGRDNLKKRVVTMFDNKGQSHGKSCAYRYNSQLQREECYVPTQIGTSFSPVSGNRGLYAYFTQQATKFAERLTTTRCWTALE